MLPNGARQVSPPARLRIQLLQIGVQHAGRCSVAAPLGKAGDFHYPHGTIQRHRDHIADLDAMPGGFFALAIDADMATFDQRSSAGAGLHHPRMP